MNTTNTLELLARFKDHSRASLAKIFMTLYGPYYYYTTTDGEVIMMILKTKDNEIDDKDLFATPGKHPSIERIFPLFENITMFDHLALLDALRKIPSVQLPVIEECEACEGDGKFRHHGEIYACKSCNEKGSFDTQRTQSGKDPAYAFKINETILSIKHVADLLNAAHIISNKFTKPVTISVVSVKPTIVWFVINNNYNNHYMAICTQNYDERVKPLNLIDILKFTI